MKLFFSLMFVFFIANLSYSQQPPKMIINKTNGTTQEFILAEIQDITFSGQPINDTLGLLAFYPFDGNLTDSSGHGHNGINHGTTFTEDRYFRAGRALNFTGGNSSYITTTTTGALPLNDEFSICFWMKFQQSGIIIEKDILGTFNTDWSIACDASGKVGFNIGTSATIWSNGAINDNLWHFVVFLRNKANGTLSIYIDGNLDRQANGYFNDLTGNANINFGAWDGSTGFKDGFTGKIDQVRFYSRELIETEIQYLWNNY